MARSRILGLVRGLAIAAAIGVTLQACAPAPKPAPAVVAPMPKDYSCDQLRRLAADMRALPPGSMAQQALNDYGEERDKLRAVHGLPDPPKCPLVQPIVRVK